jgi:hypothetical protein
MRKYLCISLIIFSLFGCIPSSKPENSIIIVTPTSTEDPVGMVTPIPTAIATPLTTGTVRTVTATCPELVSLATRINLIIETCNANPAVCQQAGVIIAINQANSEIGRVGQALQWYAPVAPIVGQ